MQNDRPLKSLQFYPPGVTRILNLTEQLRSWQSGSAAEIRRMQTQQALQLTAHAYQHSPYWRETINAVLTPSDEPGKITLTADVFRALPPLTRTTLQEQPERLRARWPGLQDKSIVTHHSSGSTGIPVRVEKDANTYQPLYSAISWLEAQWHGRDPNLKFAVISTGFPKASHPSWGSFYQAMGFSGPSEVRPAESGTLDQHLDWLLDWRPAYLKTSPNLAAELAQRLLERGQTLALQQVISQWERISLRHRQLCRKAFGAPIVDRYSCEEAGWLALECPEQGKLHVVSPSVLVEIVDEQRQPCPPGKPGSVLITPLHQAAMPLLRYELGDLAQWGEPCRCGLHWPVIDQLLGRERHMISAPDGRRIPMPFLGDELSAIHAIRAFQVKQYAGRDIELLIESDGPLSLADRQRIQHIFAAEGLAGFPLIILDQQQIDWGNGRKRQEFIAEDSPRPVGAAR